MMMTNPAAIDYGGKVSKEEMRRQKDLDAARKAGTQPAAIDADGNAINPHIPNYITKAPWYAEGKEGPSLGHQRLAKKEEKRGADKFEEWYDRGARAGPAAKKFRKGACENCGAMSHKKQDCVERPRKKGAKFTNKDIMADEVLQKFDGDYDAKRDRWNGYDPSAYRSVVDEYEAAEAARLKYREAEIDKQATDDPAAKEKAKKEKRAEDDDFGSSDEDEEDEFKYAEAADQVGQSVDTKNRITVRNLRLREDTAKYLINLNPESAYYDPKTRSMRDAPDAGLSLEDQKFAGDNFTRFSGDATNMQKLQAFAWQSTQRGNTLHVAANPTAGELLHKEYLQKKDVLKTTSKTSILEKYGGEKYLERLPKELLSGQSEQYVEYSRTGELIKGQDKPKVRSRYDEDVLLNNHKAVWGSWYDRESAQWGFACCHSTISGSYCTGEAGLAANTALSTNALLESREEHDRIQAAAEAERAAKAEELRNASAAASGSGSTKRKEAVGWSKPTEGEEIELDKSRLKAAIDEEKKRKNLTEDELVARSKKSKSDVTNEEMEAYRMSKQAYDDPMANYKDEEDL